MRDIAITAIVVIGLIIALGRPHIGLYLWSWLGYMNPHRLSWGFAHSLPFVQLSALATFAGMVFSGQKLRFANIPLVWVWLSFVLWQVISTFSALNFDISYPGLEVSLKIQLMILVTILVIDSREKLHGLVMVIAFSIGFFGAKGGVFTILTGGQHRVWGPPSSFIEGNNELALALVVIIPLLRYIQMESQNPWIRRGLALVMVLCVASILASYSRGAFLAGSAMGLFLILKSKRRVALLLAGAVSVVLLLNFMPEKWFDRMSTIQTYEEDASAQGRLNAWAFAVNLANDHPLTGGGFRTFTRELFLIYAPKPEGIHDAHSIYFEVLAEQGYVGLMLFLMMWFLTWKTASRVVRIARNSDDLHWAGVLASMCQVSLIGYWVGGAFLGLAYYDLPYHLMAIVVILDRLVRDRQCLDDDRSGERVSIQS